jgi:hypothetical protein
MELKLPYIAKLQLELNHQSPLSGDNHCFIFIVSVEVAIIDV